MRRSQTPTVLRRRHPLASAAMLLVTGCLLSSDAVSAADVENPRVHPGDVKWHPDFDAACAAATESGRPVLLFQMMGNLDEAFT